jgi:hypothetical protein
MFFILLSRIWNSNWLSESSDSSRYCRKNSNLPWIQSLKDGIIINKERQKKIIERQSDFEKDLTHLTQINRNLWKELNEPRLVTKNLNNEFEWLF